MAASRNPLQNSSSSAMARAHVPAPFVPFRSESVRVAAGLPPAAGKAPNEKTTESGKTGVPVDPNCSGLFVEASSKIIGDDEIRSASNPKGPKPGAPGRSNRPTTAPPGVTSQIFKSPTAIWSKASSTLTSARMQFGPMVVKVDTPGSKRLAGSPENAPRVVVGVLVGGSVGGSVGDRVGGSVNTSKMVGTKVGLIVGNVVEVGASVQ